MNRSILFRAAWVTIGSLLMALLLSRYQKHGLIDSSFLVSLLLLSASGLIYVVRGGFFDSFAKAFKKLNRISQPEWHEGETEIEDPDETKKRRKVLKEWAIILFLAGLGFFLLSWALMWLG
jgi:hypothetical protein